MSKLKTRILSVSLAGLMAVSALSGCSQSSGGGTSGSTGGAKTSGSSSQPFEFSYMSCIGAPFSEHTDNKVITELQKKANVKIKFTWVPTSGYDNKVSAMLASGNIPDVINGTSSTQALLLNQGAVVPLDDLLKSNGQNVLKRFTSDEYLSLRNPNDDKIYSIPTIVDFPYCYSWCYREDMAKNVGITKEPVTWDDWKNMWRAVKTKDANKDGNKAQKVPYCGDIYSLMPLFDMNVADNIGFMVEDGKYIMCCDSKNFTTFLNEMRSLYKEGLLDPEFTTRGTFADTADNIDDAINSGLAFSYMTYAANAKDSTITLQKTNKNAVIRTVNPPKSPIDGSQRIPARNKLYYGACMTVNAQKAGKLQKIMDYFNYAFSDEGAKLTSYGIDGEMNTTKDGKTVIKSPYVDAFNNARSNGINFTPFTHYFEGDAFMQLTLGGEDPGKLDPPTQQFYNGLINNKPYLFPPTPCFQTKAYQDNQGVVIPKVTTLIAECVIGKISVDSFFSQYKALKSQGLQEMIDQGNTAYQKITSTSNK